MMNFIAFILCGAFAVWHGIDGEIGLCIFESALALINLPFVIQWVSKAFLIKDNT